MVRNITEMLKMHEVIRRSREARRLLWIHAVFLESSVSEPALCPEDTVMNMTDKSLPPGSINPVGKQSEKVEM